MDKFWQWFNKKYGRIYEFQGKTFIEFSGIKTLDGKLTRTFEYDKLQPQMLIGYLLEYIEERSFHIEDTTEYRFNALSKAIDTIEELL